MLHSPQIVSKSIITVTGMNKPIHKKEENKLMKSNNRIGGLERSMMEFGAVGIPGNITCIITHF